MTVPPAPKAHSTPSTQPRATPLGGWGVGASLLALGAYLVWLFSALPRNGAGYPYMHSLFDYANGVSRRALEGEIARHLVAPPFTETGFSSFSYVLEAIALIVLYAGVSIALYRTRAKALLVVTALLVASPAGLKNLFFDHGRQDLFGLILVLLVFVLQAIGWRRAGFWVFTAAVVPLCLIADNQLFLYVPLGLLMTAIEWNHGPVRPAEKAWLPLVVCLFALSLSFTLPVPQVTQEAYGHYLQVKSASPLGEGAPWGWLYRTTGENLRFAHQEMLRLGDSYLKRLPDILLIFGLLGISVAFVYRSLGTLPGVRRLYLWGVAFMALGYVGLYLLASDWSRWTSNLDCALWVFGLFVLSQGWPLRRATPLALVLGLAALCLAQNPTPYGIVEPSYKGGSYLLRVVDRMCSTHLAPVDPEYVEADVPLLTYSRRWGSQAPTPLLRGYLRSLLGVHAEVPHARFLLPSGPHGGVEPLLVSGVRGLQNYIYLYYGGPNLIQVCYESEGHGGPLSAPIPVAASVPHEVTIVNGTDLPLPGDPFWNGKDPQEVADTRARMVVLFDGKTVLDSAVPPQPSHGFFYWGVSLFEAPFGERFSGTFIDKTPAPARRRPSMDREDVQAYGPAVVTLKPMGFAEHAFEPVLSIGYRHEGGALVSLRREDSRHFTVSYREENGTIQSSLPFECDPTKPHEVTVRLPSLYPPADSALWQDDNRLAYQAGILSTKRIEWDGQTILELKTAAKTAAPSSLAIGINAISQSGVAPAFQGSLGLRRLPWPAR